MPRVIVFKEPVMKTRSERERELQCLAATETGKWQLIDMVKLYLGIPQGESIPVSTLLIYVILRDEYPEG